MTNEVEFSTEDSTKAFEQMMIYWVAPEIRHRQAAGLAPIPLVLGRAQVIVPSAMDKQPIVVRLNEEVQADLDVDLGEGRDIVAGEPIYEIEVSDIKGIALTPDDDQNAGHMTALRVKGTWYFAFDLRY